MGGTQIFLATVRDMQWALLCAAFDFSDLATDPRLAAADETAQTPLARTVEHARNAASGPGDLARMERLAE